MYIQHFIKGIAGQHANDGVGLTWSEAQALIRTGEGVLSNWWRNKRQGTICPSEVQEVLTAGNLDRHLHDYDNFGDETPFISLASGCVERDVLLQRNHIHSALDVALDFATDAWGRPGALFYGWVIAGLNPAVELRAVAEAVRELNVYHRWSPYQLEGEVTAKVHIPANQIERVEWWDGSKDRDAPVKSYDNPAFVGPDPITNLRERF